MADAADLKSLAIRATKGNELMSFVSEDMQAGMFQAALADGLDIQKAILVKKTVAVLGCRGDYLEGVLFCTPSEGGEVPNINTVYMEVVDYTGVPAAVQHTVFGQYSPFVSPKETVQDAMMNGIDIQDMSVTNSEIIASQAACATGKSQMVRGSLDSRITYQADHDDFESATELSLKFKPNSDGVFIVRKNARLWANPAANALG